MHALPPAQANPGGNADLASVSMVQETYAGFGVDADHLGIIFPWFGCDFVCDPHADPRKSPCCCRRRCRRRRHAVGCGSWVPH